MRLLIVSGLSGSGKSTALHALEDQDFYCIDNLPVELLHVFVERMLASSQPNPQAAAVGIDARNFPDELARFPAILGKLRALGVDCEIVFLGARDEILLKRFSETRRKHPLTSREVALAEAIRKERELLEPIFANADLYIDTSETNLHRLRELVVERVCNRVRNRLSLLFVSFGYKHGIPGDVDFVFDVRCLPNPHWEPSLRPHSGKDQPVATFLEQQPAVEQMFESIRDFLQRWIPAFEAENRAYMTVAIGCTGGQHRSVYLVERLARHFGEQLPSVLSRHREVP